MQLFGVLDILSFVRINVLNWIGRVNRMDSKRKLNEVLHDNNQGCRLRGRQKNQMV
jgi:hypothetical protein